MSQAEPPSAAKTLRNVSTLNKKKLSPGNYEAEYNS
jgi:hypothetical protein